MRVLHFLLARRVAIGDVAHLDHHIAGRIQSRAVGRFPKRLWFGQHDVGVLAAEIVGGLDRKSVV